MKNIFACFFFLSISLNGFSQNLDIDILKNINLNRNENLDQTFEFISNTITPVSLGAPVLILSIGLIKKDHDITRDGLIIAESILVSTLITSALKYSVNRTRPYDTYPFIDNVIFANGPSFPSGHTSAAFTTATSLSLAYPEWYVIVPSFAWASAVGYSRLDLGVHYPSDVLVGAIVGTGSAYLCYFVNKKLLNKKLNRRRK